MAEAAIIAARHPKWDERPLLILTAKPGHDIDTRTVMDIFDGKIAAWWKPDDVLVLPELPHTATGKVHKMILRDAYKDHLIK